MSVFCLDKGDNLRFCVCVLRISCRSRMDVCIPIVFRVMVVIEGWEYSWIGEGVLGCEGLCSGGWSRWMCVLLG